MTRPFLTPSPPGVKSPVVKRPDALTCGPSLPGIRRCNWTHGQFLSRFDLRGYPVLDQGRIREGIGSHRYKWSNNPGPERGSGHRRPQTRRVDLPSRLTKRSTTMARAKHDDLRGGRQDPDHRALRLSPQGGRGGGRAADGGGELRRDRGRKRRDHRDEEHPPQRLPAKAPGRPGSSRSS